MLTRQKTPLPCSRSTLKRKAATLALFDAIITATLIEQRIYTAGAQHNPQRLDYGIDPSVMIQVATVANCPAAG